MKTVCRIGLALLVSMLASCKTPNPERVEAELAPKAPNQALSLDVGDPCFETDVKVVVRAIWNSGWCMCKRTKTDTSSCDGSCTGTPVSEVKPVSARTGRIAAAAEAEIDPCDYKLPRFDLASCEQHCKTACGETGCRAGTEGISCFGMNGNNENCSWTCPADQACGGDCYQCSTPTPPAPPVEPPF
ncbi:MAG: hypothetical protein NTV34_04360 [Proteobacteria bacterium]|nr:hypothetical protein [Pseudomonadota bacterium]